jgi:DNA-binding beta-propeller fold protein YncE
VQIEIKSPIPFSPRLTPGLLAVLATVAFWAAPAHATELFMSSYGNGDIYSVNSDGTGFATPFSSGSSAVGIAVSGGKVYFADQSNGLLRSMNLDGTGVTTLDSGYSSPVGVTVDAVHGKLYVADRNTDTITPRPISMDRASTSSTRQPAGSGT